MVTLILQSRIAYGLSLTVLMNRRIFHPTAIYSCQPGFCISVFSFICFISSDPSSGT